MDIRKLQRAIVDGLEDVKAQDIRVFNTEHLSALFERVVVASGTSNRQTKALASSVRDSVKSAGFGVPRTEGEENGEWIIVDCGAAVVHVMQPAIRDYYRLEEIWGEKKVAVKLAAAKKAAAKPDAPTEPAAKPVARAAAAKKPTVKQPAAKTPAAKRPAAKRPGAKATAVSTTRRSPSAAKSAAKSPAKAPAKTVAKKATPRPRRSGG
jgi:ribosome-associated protein